MAEILPRNPLRLPKINIAQIDFKKYLPIAVVALLFGGGGGLIAYYTTNHALSAGSTTTSTHQVVLEENSAIIGVVNKLGASVVNIATDTSSQNIFGLPQDNQASGSGIIISADGLILTNKHVIDGASTITVTTSDNKVYKNATVVGTDPSNDIAFIKVNGSNLTAATLGNSDGVVVGQQVVAIGNALGQYSNTVTSGIISGIGRPVVAGDGTNQAEQLQDLLQTDAAINPGNSGGPLVDLESNVIGMDTAIAGNAQNIGFAIPINQVKADIASIQKTGKLAKAYLGVRYLDIDAQVQSQYKLSVSEGAYVIGASGQSGVIAGGPADNAGVKEGDIVTVVNGTKLTATNSLSTLVGQFQPGDKVTLTILRGKQTLQITVTLGTLPTS